MTRDLEKSNAHDPSTLPTTLKKRRLILEKEEALEHALEDEETMGKEDEKEALNETGKRRRLQQHQQQGHSEHNERREMQMEDGVINEEMNGETRSNNVDMNAKDMELEELNEEQEKALQQEVLGLLQSSSRNQRKGKNTNAGWIEYIELINFMCHSYLRIPFGPSINFVIGRNGSGKSAVLTALMVCLGGKANATNRASNIKELIRTGANVGQVVVAINNMGEDAFNHGVYGDHIAIERRFTMEGNSSYRIKTSQGKIISNKREELVDILDHFNIQIDNPMTILSQDTARHFLNSSSPQDKYHFFMRGSGLEQISSDFLHIRERKEYLKSIVQKKKEVLPDMRENLNILEAKYKELEAMQEQEKVMQDLKNELAWSFVIEKEKEVKKIENEMAGKAKKMNEAQEKLTKTKEELTSYTEETIKIDGQVNEMAKQAEITLKRKREIQLSIQAFENEFRDFDAQIHDAEKTKHQYELTIDQLATRIQEEVRKLETSSQERTKSREQHMRELHDAIRQLSDEHTRLKNQRDQLDKTLEMNKDRVRDQKDSEKQLTNEVNSLQNTIRRLEGARDDKIKAFGDTMPEILRAIQVERRFRHAPQGPIGLYIRLKDRKWKTAMEAIMGNFMDAFVVRTQEDQRILKDILTRFQAKVNIIVLAEDTLYDTRSKEPDTSFLTPLRAIECESDLILNSLIVHAGIERHILIESESQARRIMLLSVNPPMNVDSCFTLEGGRLSIVNGSGSFFSYQPDRNKSRYFDDIEQQVAECRQELVHKQAQYLNSIEIGKEIVQTDDNSRKRFMEIRRELQDQQTQLNRLHHEMEELRDQVQLEPASISALEEELEKTRSSLLYMTNQLNDLKIQRHELDKNVEPSRQNLIEVIKELEDLKRQRDDLVSIMEKSANRRANLANIYDYEKSKHITCSGEFEQVQLARNELVKDMEETTLKAMRYYHDRIETRKTPTQLEKDIRQIEKNLSEKEKEHGHIEDVAAVLLEARGSYNNIKAFLRNSELLNERLTIMLSKRIERWARFRDMIVLRAKSHFIFYLSMRGYTGRMSFNHTVEKLFLKVQIDQKNVPTTTLTGSVARSVSSTMDVSGTSSSSQAPPTDPTGRDTRTLSGGERSFTTLSFLLALWEAIECPFRCLDEFDVFMDAVNRRLCMKLLIETARLTDQRQYLLITPQDMSTISLAPDVRVTRLHDPERDQPTLHPPSSFSDRVT